MSKQKALFVLLIAMVFSVYAQEIPAKSINTLSIKTKNFSNAPKKIYIRTFKVYYQMIAEAKKTVYGGRQFGGGSYTGNATARLAVGVEGVNPEDLQALTDKLYKDYIKSLEDMGFEVITANELPDLEEFEGWGTLEGPRINQEQLKGSLMVIPEGFSYKVKKVSKNGKERTGGFLTGLKNTNGGQAADFVSSIYGLLPKVSKAMDDAIVAEVAISIPSIYLDPKSKLGTAKIKGGPYLRLGQAKITYISGRAKGMGVASPNAALEFTVNKAVPIPNVFASEEFKVVATKLRTIVPSYATFFTVENKTVELTNTIDCEAAAYQAEVEKVVKAYLTMSLDKLSRALKGEKVK